MNEKQQELNELQISIISGEHQNWLQTNHSKQLKRVLDTYESNIEKALCASSMGIETTDARIRHLAIQLETTKQIKEIIYNADRYLAKCKRG